MNSDVTLIDYIFDVIIIIIGRITKLLFNQELINFESH